MCCGVYSVGVWEMVRAAVRGRCRMGWLGEWELVADHRACVTYYFRIPKLKQDPGVPVSVLRTILFTCVATGYPSEIHLAYVQYVAH